jgi:hypothetical protein
MFIGGIATIPKSTKKIGGMVNIPSHGWFMALFYPLITIIFPIISIKSLENPLVCKTMP